MFCELIKKFEYIYIEKIEYLIVEYYLYYLDILSK